jgi:hypothetical protein
MFGHFFQMKSYVAKFGQMRFGLHFGRFFSQTHLVTLVGRPVKLVGAKSCWSNKQKIGRQRIQRRKIEDTG